MDPSVCWSSRTMGAVKKSGSASDRVARSPSYERDAARTTSSVCRKYVLRAADQKLWTRAGDILSINDILCTVTPAVKMQCFEPRCEPGNTRCDLTWSRADATGTWLTSVSLRFVFSFISI